VETHFSLPADTWNRWESGENFFPEIQGERRESDNAWGSVCLYVYIYIYVCVYVYIYIYVCVCVYVYIRRAQVKVGLINLCKGLFSLNARIYYKLKSGT
jgi:hypothetical protein